jgi:hypothetical protein
MGIRHQILSRLKKRWIGRPVWLAKDHRRGWRNDLAEDEFVDHLRHVIGGWLLEGNLAAFDYCVKHMPAGGAVVELGSFLGLSTTILDYTIHRFRRGTPLVACDPFRFAGGDRPKAGYFSTGTEEYRQWVIDSLRRALTLYCRGHAPHVVEASSSELCAWWAEHRQVVDILGAKVQLGGAVSFAYVDGDHSYEGVRSDFNGVDRFLLPGGFILLDDSADTSSYEGIRQFVREARHNSRYEAVMKAPNYCFRKRV